MNSKTKKAIWVSASLLCLLGNSMGSTFAEPLLFPPEADTVEKRIEYVLNRLGHEEETQATTEKKTPKMTDSSKAQQTDYVLFAVGIIATLLAAQAVRLKKSNAENAIGEPFA